MPPRLNKRQQRELEELEALSKSSAPDANVEDSDEEEEPIVNAGPQLSAFSMLLEDSDDSDDETSKNKTKKAKKKKPRKKIASTTEKPPPTLDTKPSKPTTTDTPPTPARDENEHEHKDIASKKAAKKAAQRAKKVAASGVNDLDAALAELGLAPKSSSKDPSAQLASTSSDTSSSISHLLSVNQQHLDADAELKRFFGKRIVSAAASSEGGAGGNTRGAGRAAAGRLPRSILTRPKVEWGPAGRGAGLSTRPLTQQELSDRARRHEEEEHAGERIYTVEYSKRYRQAAKSFMRVVQSGDPQGFYNILRLEPWQADTLLQFSEVYRHREEHGPASDFLTRAIFAYERALPASFLSSSPPIQLDFDFVENRPLFLVLHRHVVDLHRRGCIRTAFEFAKFLWSLDIRHDPHHVLGHLEYLAIRNGKEGAEWLLAAYKLFDRPATEKSKGKAKEVNPTVLPGWMYARALALRIVATTDAERDFAKKALVDAVTSFPTVVPLLADKTDASVPGHIRAHKDFAVKLDSGGMSEAESIIHIHSHLYSQRAFGAWKDPAHASWFSSVLTDHFPSATSLPSSMPVTDARRRCLDMYAGSKGLRWAVYRHVITLESSHRRLFSFIPSALLNDKELTLSCDPLPPQTSVTSYNDAFFEGVGELRAVAGSRSAAAGGIERMIPNAGMRNQLRDVFLAVPGLQARFAVEGDQEAGLLNFVRALAQGEIGMEELEGLMMVQAFENQGERPDQAGGMPGGFEHNVMEEIFDAVEPDEEDPLLGQDERDNDEDRILDDEEDDEEVPSLPVRVLQGVFRRFGLWGGTEVEAESSSDDEGHPDLD